MQAGGLRQGCLLSALTETHSRAGPMINERCIVTVNSLLKAREASPRSYALFRRRSVLHTLRHSTLVKQHHLAGPAQAWRST